MDKGSDSIQARNLLFALLTCSTTHIPLWAPSAISAAALGPCPCPSDTAVNREAMLHSPTEEGEWARQVQVR